MKTWTAVAGARVARWGWSDAQLRQSETGATLGHFTAPLTYGLP